MVMLLFGLDDHRVGLIPAGQVIAIDQAIDFSRLASHVGSNALVRMSLMLSCSICRLSKMFATSGYRAAKAGLYSAVSGMKVQCTGG